MIATATVQSGNLFAIRPLPQTRATANPIPRIIGEQISRGIIEISRGLLNELPDSVQWDDINSGSEWVLPQFGSKQEQRRKISGDAIKLWDDNFIESDEEIQGHVVSIFGNCLISGYVDGNVVVVFGDLEIDETAEISGKAISILGRLDRSPEADVGSVLVIDPFGFGGIDNFRDWLLGGPQTLLLLMILFVINYLLLVVLVLLIPERRFLNAEHTLATRASRVLGFGLIIAILGPVGLLVLSAVLVITVIGIPLALLLILAAFLLGICSLAVVSVLVGRHVARVFSLNLIRLPVLALVGMTVLFLPCGIGVLVSLVPAVSTLGMVVGFCGIGIISIANILGLGAITISRLGSLPTDSSQE